MSKIDDGGAAFPRDRLSCSGLTKREYFAAAALTGMLTRSDYDDNTIAEVVDTALCYADALIAASKSRGSDE